MSLGKKALAEALGTFWLVFGGCGAAVLAGGQIGWLGVSFAFGLTVVSCERGDIRQSPDGLLVHSDKGREEIALPNDKSPRDLVIEEFAQAIAGKPVTHTGRWGVANLEVCTAAIESSRTGKEIELKHQVAVK